METKKYPTETFEDAISLLKMATGHLIENGLVYTANLAIIKFLEESKKENELKVIEY